MDLPILAGFEEDLLEKKGYPYSGLENSLDYPMESQRSDILSDFLSYIKWRLLSFGMFSRFFMFALCKGQCEPSDLAVGSPSVPWKNG